MPLTYKKGSKPAFRSNIAELIRSGRDPKQAAAIAFAVKRGKSKKPKK
jgi:hypothetical protein